MTNGPDSGSFTQQWRGKDGTNACAWLGPRYSGKSLFKLAVMS